MHTVFPLDDANLVFWESNFVEFRAACKLKPREQLLDIEKTVSDAMAYVGIAASPTGSAEIKHQIFQKPDDRLDTPPESPTMGSFDPSRHLNFSPPKEFYTLEELGLSSEGSTSPVAITAPFPLLSEEGIKATRADLFRQEILEKYRWKEAKDPNVYKLRGYAQAAPFVYDMWSSDAMLKACSQAAGCDLEVVFDYEIGHINVQLPPGKAKSDADIENLLPPAVPPRQRADVDSTAAEEAAKEDIQNVTSWHNDSYPWVCVVMLSDPTGMKGGETALRKGDGSLLKVRGPSMGSAVMMQGGLINHVALKALGDGERITMVTSFRPKDPHMPDSSNLGNVRKVSEKGALYSQWSVYRAEVLARRAQIFAEKMRKASMSSEDVERVMEEWTKEQIQFLQFSANEITTNGSVGNYDHSQMET